jgi:Kef-type K+ transport system membrane component KefB
LAGFALGLVISATGEPRRLARQLFGITEGFFAPLFFVWLGASLQVRELAAHPLLILGLGVGAILAQGVGRLFGQPLTRRPRNWVCRWPRRPWAPNTICWRPVNPRR